MLTITLELDAELAISAITRARDGGLPLNQFCASTLRQALRTNDLEVEAPSRAQDDWLDEAVQRAKARRTSAKFKLQDLFSKQEWSQIPSPTVFGRAFRKLAEERGFAAHIGKTSINQAIYQRT
jgi:hypothetical protein